MGNPYAPPRPDAPQQPRPEPQQPPQEGARPDAPVPPPPDVPPSGTTPPPGPPGTGWPAPLVTDPQADRRPAPNEPPEPDPELARAATRRVLHFGLLLLAVIVVSTMPFPWQAVSLALAVGAIVVGIRALLAVWRARVRGALVPALGIGVGLSAMLALQMVSTLVTWDVALAHQQCLDGAITVSAEKRCDVERTQALEETFARWFPTPAPASS
ncbi:hypothetical protein [Cellulosimicrobium protaetiae]|uniref:Uncharacterized protein n=1 Tax=Cellulosimicrobium protaetiae TaxID=2587808 RepID=A0A6M5UJU2_9MICO|nr:hypothetical protein [Cellulosimicrobium protaetiae]QJW37481.1 hypothetical protein FIC82_016130 [Cellulosimicrobium protaetiae]